MALTTTILTALKIKSDSWIDSVITKGGLAAGLSAGMQLGLTSVILKELLDNPPNS